jgi:glycosyltransferase involved in cell wall biosynthesis
VASAKPEDLAAAIWEISSDEEFKKKLINNGLQTAAEWPWERLIEAFEKRLQSWEQTTKKTG